MQYTIEKETKAIPAEATNSTESFSPELYARILAVQAEPAKPSVIPEQKSAAPAALTATAPGGINYSTTINRTVENFGQGGIGDCWYLASIKSLSVSSLGQQIIYNAITPTTTSASLKLAGANGYTYSTTLAAITAEATDGDTYTSAGHSSGDADTLLYEMALKAYSANASYKNAYFTSSAYSGGWMNQALSLITGKESLTFNNWSNDLAATTAKLNELAQIIDHTAITAAVMYQSNSSLDIAAAGHAYSIVGIDTVNQTVSFRNPWYSGTALKQISYANFSYYFQRIDYCDLTTNNACIYASNLGGLITTGSGNDVLYGGKGNDIFNSGYGTDKMYGGAGNDTYYVDNTSDYIYETANAGIDTVCASYSYTLGANLENLTLTGANAINGVGNTLNNTLTGNAANNVLNGSTGADRMVGGLGNDSYYVDNAGDIVVENSSAGIDTIYSGITYTLGANLENLTLYGSSLINGYGNTLNNVITGNNANNIINGYAGADTMSGGLGNDIYYADNAGDKIIENENSGTDSVYSSVTHTLSANVENLILTGTASINGVGNTSNNTITGNAGNNIINGSSGADRMIGGLGNDSYYVENIGDVVVENANQGTDTVYSSINYTLGANVENLTLFGTSAVNATGNSLNNVITGNSANNILSGGAGNDTYIINAGCGSDTIADSAGSDLIKFASSVAKNTIGFFKQGLNLIIGNTNGDRITISGQSSATTAVEKIQLSTGQFLTSANINSLIQNMSSFAVSSSAQISSIDDVLANQSLMAMTSNAWHS